MTRRRVYVDPPLAGRCAQSITLRDGTRAQCGRRRVVGDRCRQHAAPVPGRIVIRTAAPGTHYIIREILGDRVIASPVFAPGARVTLNTSEIRPVSL